MAVNGLALSPAGATPSGRPVTFDIDGSVVLSTPNGDVPFPMHGIASGPVNGNSVELPIAGSSFDSGSGVFNGLAVTVQPAFTSAFGGTLDASSGAVDFAGAITVYVSVPRIGVNDCPFGPVFVDLTGTNYNSATGTANLSDNQAIIPAVPPSPACGGGGVAPIINSTLGLPAQVQVTSTVTATPRIVNHMVKG